MAPPTSGFLLIADITGYTGFLKESELEHAQETLTALLKLLLSETRPPFVVSRTAGDAIISYAFGEPFLQPQTFVDRLESTYVAFKEAVRRMSLNNTCQCSACANVSSLDLKFFVHHGTFGVQDLAGREELVGSDVNLLHRLLKNSVTEQTGLRAYALYTEAALDKLGLGEWKESLAPLVESYEHLGDVAIRVQDLAPLRKRSEEVVMRDDEVTVHEVFETKVSAERLWDALQDPERRRAMIGSDRIERSTRNGRMDQGAEFLCYHGDLETRQLILAWEPTRRVLTEDRVAIGPLRFALRFEFSFEPTEAGSRMTYRIGTPTGPFAGRVLARAMRRKVYTQTTRGLNEMIAHLEAT